MLNALWSGMLLIGIVWGMSHGQLAAVTEGALTAAKEAVALSITMLGVMSMWSGILEIGQQAGLIDQLSRKLRPFFRFMFPDLPPESEAAKQISINVVANVFGLGGAATPAGLKAMKELKKLQEKQGMPGYAPADSRKGRMQKKRAGKAEVILAPVVSGNVQEGVASNEMCTFLILNISSLQLIPVNMMAYRSQYGSVNPAGIIAPAILATLISTLVAMAFCKIMDRKQRK